MPPTSTERYLVVIFGWLQAEERYLQKYVQFYTRRGFNVASYVAPMMLAAFPVNVDHFSKRVSSELIRYLAPLDSGRSPHTKLLFHVFSNNGYFNYCFLLHYLQNTTSEEHAKLYYRIAGSIVDSAPSPLSVDLLTRGFVGSFLAHQKLEGGRHPFITPIISAIWSLFLLIPSFRKHMAHANSLMEKQHTHDDWPYLFLYSTADIMVFGSDTEHHIKYLQAKQIDIDSFDFKTSKHVEHMREFPEVYERRVAQFLAKVDTKVGEQEARLTNNA